MYLYLSQTMYDNVSLVLGPNLGYDPTKVTILITPLFKV